MKNVPAALTVLVVLSLTGCSGGVSPEESDYLSVVDVKSDRTAHELLEAAHAACEQILEGRDIFQVRVFDDDSHENGFYEDSVRVALAAAPRLCPDLS